jgi:hypothetical protein
MLTQVADGVWVRQSEWVWTRLSGKGLSVARFEPKVM